MPIPNHINIYISFATKDAEIFHVPQLAKNLEDYPEIGEVIYYQENVSETFIEYISKHVKNSDVCIFCYSKIVNEPPIVKMERKIAMRFKKFIIPLFVDINVVPLRNQIQCGIDIRNNSIEKNAKEIFQLILKKKSDTERTLQEKIPIVESTKIVVYNGTPLLRFECDVLITLTKTVGEIPIVSNVDDSTFGFVSRENHIIHLGIYKKDLISLPMEIGNLTSLKELYLNNNKLTFLVRHSKALIYSRMESGIQGRSTVDTDCEEGALKHAVKCALLEGASVIGYG